MGQCYAHEQLKCYDAAAKCYRRAVTSGDHENIVLHKLAELYKIMKQYDAAFSCYKQNLEYIDQQNTSGQVRPCSSCVHKRYLDFTVQYEMKGDS
jgi:tetratricopeptide (TPR) repeat protein